MEKLVAFYALMHCQGVSTKTVLKLTTHFQCDIADIPTLPKETLAAQGLSSAQIEQLKADYKMPIQRIMNWLNHGSDCPRQVIYCDDADYPQYLSHLHDRPFDIIRRR